MVDPPLIASVPLPAFAGSEPAHVSRLTWLWIRRERMHGLWSFLTSLLVHAGLVLVLAVMVLHDEPLPHAAIVLLPIDGEPAIDLNSVTLDPVAEAGDLAALAAELPSRAQAADAPNVPSPLAGPEVSRLPTFPLEQALQIPAESLLMPSDLTIGGGFAGRAQEQRARLAATRGGSAGSESAVELGLAWLAAHQWQDGGWRLDHRDGPCQNRCGNPGTAGTSTGATALGLLPFLGAGYAHTQGKYREVVERGLYYLTGHMLDTPHGGDLQEGTMYAQGLAAITLCEAYAMTGDQKLEPYAQKAIDFICAAQHPGGGWRYFPGQPGDTTVSAWQVMALKSAHLARLSVPSPVTELAKSFLDSVQDGGGAYYGYQEPARQPGTTAVGLLMRMYLGWRRDDPRLGRGVSYLANLGPSRTDVYFNYYATQVLNHYEGPLWERWNARMRDQLVNTQSQTGHEKGSWFFPDRHGSLGGRVYTTSMCLMILEVYYRYMPLYDRPAVDDDF